MSRRLPKHMSSYFGTMRNFKIQKRNDLRETLNCFDELSFGSAYMSADAVLLVGALRSNLKALSEELAIKKWGR